MVTTCSSTLHRILVNETLEYASPAWDPSTSEDVTKLEKVQRQAACFVHNNYYDRTPGCVSKMVSDLGWESLQHRRRVDRLTTLYKIQHGLVELDTGVVRPGDKRTRGQHRLYQPVAKSSIYKNSFFPRTIRDWNLLPTSVTDATAIEEFRVGLGHAQPAFQQ